MGEDHKENLMRCLRQWHEITLKQGEALSKGDLPLFEKLERVSLALQERLDGHFTRLKPARLDHEGLILLKEIHACQSRFIAELTSECQKISGTICSTRKNRTSIKGYRQNKGSIPRIKSQRT
jgi:hypothetical protein